MRTGTSCSTSSAWWNRARCCSHTEKANHAHGLRSESTHVIPKSKLSNPYPGRRWRYRASVAVDIRRRKSFLGQKDFSRLSGKQFLRAFGVKFAKYRTLVCVLAAATGDRSRSVCVQHACERAQILMCEATRCEHKFLCTLTCLREK